jgi:hypothetical protein
MNLQENIRRILKEIEEDKIQIRLGRSAERHFGKVQNIIIMVDDQDITSEDDVPGLGKMNIVIKDNEIIVGDIFIPEKYRKQGIATIVYQKISDYFNLPIVNSKTKGFNQTIEGGHIWKKRERFEPKNLQEQISRIQSMMGTINESKEKKELPPFLKRRFTEDELDFEFYDALDYAKGLLNNTYSRTEKTLENYISLTIRVLMDNLHPILTIRIGEDVEWYETIENALKDYYRDEITKEYKSMEK